MKENLPEREKTCAADVPEQRALPQKIAETDAAVLSQEAAGAEAAGREVPPTDAPQAGESAGADAAVLSQEAVGAEAAGREALPTDAPQAGEVAGADAAVLSQEAAGAEAAGREALPTDAGTDGHAIPSEECALPMAWHRFLTRFGLWLEAAIHAFQGVWLLWGGQYYTAELRARVRTEFPLLWAMDGLLAVVLLLAAGMCVRTAIVLRGRRADGARLLQGTYLTLLGGQLIFGAGRWFLIGLTPLSMSVLCPAALYLALLLVNRAYYRRRRQNASDACAPGNGAGGAFEP